MKLTIAVLLMPLLASTAVQAGNSTPQDPRWEPRGPVREVLEYTSEDEEERLINQYHFNRRGKLKELVRYIPNPDEPVTQTFSYNDQGLLEHWLARGPSGRVLWGYRYRYDQEGTLLQETEYGQGETISGQRVFTSQREGETVRVEESAYDSSGEVLWWMQRLRSTGNPGEDWSLYYPDGRIITEGSRLYDLEGRIIREEERDTTTQSSITTTYRYSQGDQPTRIEERNHDETLLRREEFQYDQFGNPLLHRISSASDESHTTRYYQYNYDDHGNWISRITWNVRTKENQLKAVTETRTIRRFTYREEE
ncbi:hypothetical protein SAMN05920897_11220 [Alkalispirochaeta americana]|uniref:YD repeat-containing protein n=1 Tax=Alkalispirochaeta americana TaxID=159291 RepID=A0A1N6UCY6_9SPIO|nr:hypothetical protein [Alkalispirochaeta americana]SIQ63472.1 hypothetical protein SAMN05920897_11220 [Alkalispirochaeta americana]